ncbi:MAG: hypothetical protein E7362_01365 [Clostridiales bacterium]|nr:hypothetical protein [Clostridiales bacterium]
MLNVRFFALKLKDFLAFIFLVFISVLLCVDRRYSVSILYGIELWIACVLPALLPYLVISSILSSLKTTRLLALKLSGLSKRFFNTNGLVCYAFIISIISGYPIGAKIVSDLRLNKLISQTEAVRASALCSTSSPTFLILSIGGITFDSTTFGTTLFLCHILSAIITGFAFSFYKRGDKPTLLLDTPKSKTHEDVFSTSIYNSVISVLVVGGTIALFYLLTDVLLNLNVLSPFSFIINLAINNKSLSDGLLLGLFECTRGVKTLATAGITKLTLPITAFICGFGGLSVIAQSLTHLMKAKIKTAPFVFSKLLCAVINFILGLIISTICF